MRMLTRSVALGEPWTQDDADRVAAVFDDLAEEWSARNIDDTKAAPVRDAFERGDVPTEGAWLELGSGTGAGTRILSGIVGSLIATDLSAEMLHHAPPELAPRVRADASMLPYRDRSFDAVLMINMLLFPQEVERVLRNCRNGAVGQHPRRSDADPSPARRRAHRAARQLDRAHGIGRHRLLAHGNAGLTVTPRTTRHRNDNGPKTTTTPGPAGGCHQILVSQSTDSEAGSRGSGASPSPS